MNDTDKAIFQHFINVCTARLAGDIPDLDSDPKAARSLVYNLNVREGPSTRDKIVGKIHPTMTVWVYEEVSIGQSVWVRISNESESPRWCAFIYAGRPYMEWIG